LDAQECRRRFAGADHAYLATTGLDARPHLVPVVVALHVDRIVFAVDDKPKRTTALRRLRNIRENPRVAFLVDEYSGDWDSLWWVRADAVARVVEGGDDHAAAVEMLRRRHHQYARRPLTAAVVVADVDRWVGWAATAD
jgi:PPOX class probable F420-dependent enzyme